MMNQTAFFTMFPLRGANRTFAVRSPRQYFRLADAIEAAAQANSRPTWDTTAGLMTAVECLIANNGRVHHLTPLPWDIIDCTHQDAGPFHQSHYGETLIGPELGGYRFGLRQSWYEKHDAYPYCVTSAGKDLRTDAKAKTDLITVASEKFREMVLEYNSTCQSEQGQSVHYLPIGIAIENYAVHLVADERKAIRFTKMLKAA